MNEKSWACDERSRITIQNMFTYICVSVKSRQHTHFYYEKYLVMCKYFTKALLKQKFIVYIAYI